MRRGIKKELAIAAIATALAAGVAGAEPVAVRFREGLVHGFLVLRTLDGKTLANGDLIQTARGTTVTSRLVFRFKDGSIHDETTVFAARALPLALRTSRPEGANLPKAARDVD